MSKRDAWVAVAIVLAVAIFDALRIHATLPRALFGDEWRYLYYANNLLHGFYSPRDRIFLWNGPGYPLVLVPFVKAGWPDGARYLNALFHAGALAYAWLVLRRFARPSRALAGTLVLAAYLPIHEHVPLLYTETLCVFLVTAFVYHSLAGQRAAAGCLLGALCLTKVVFGASLTVLLVALLVRAVARRSIGPFTMQLLLAFAVCVPYLVYTWRLTGKPLYWSSAGANSFYWLSSPYAGEWGDWYHQGWVANDPILRAHHKAIFDRTTGLDRDPNLSSEEQVFNLSTPESAKIFFDAGMRNLREHPFKLALNWGANLVRLFLDVPVSVRPTRFWNSYSACNLPLLAFTIFALVRRRRAPPEEWRPIWALTGTTIAVYSVSSIVARFLIPLVPIWWLGVCAII